MKTKRRWLTAVLNEAKQNELRLPWDRSRRPAIKKRLVESTTRSRAVNT